MAHAASLAARDSYTRAYQHLLRKDSQTSNSHHHQSWLMTLKFESHNSSATWYTDMYTDVCRSSLFALTNVAKQTPVSICVPFLLFLPFLVALTVQTVSSCQPAGFEMLYLAKFTMWTPKQLRFLLEFQLNGFRPIEHDRTASRTMFIHSWLSEVHCRFCSWSKLKPVASKLLHQGLHVLSDLQWLSRKTQQDLPCVSRVSVSLCFWVSLSEEQ